LIINAGRNVFKATEVLCCDLPCVILGTLEPAKYVTATYLPSANVLQQLFN